MPEQKINYMAVLDQWTDANVFAPLLYQSGDSDEVQELTEETLDQVKKAIRTKVLDSYHNGKRAAGAPVAKKQLQR